MRYATVQKDGAALCRAMLADNYFLRLRGLLGRSLGEGEGLLLKPCAQIHTIGMRFPIDAVYLDADGRVLRIDAAIPEGKCLKGQRGARSVLELPANGAGGRGIAVGDRLEVIR